MLRVVFPHLDRVLVERVHLVDGTVRVSARRTREDGAFPGPGCGVPSQRAHSRYRRRIADTAIGGQPVLIELSVRRLFCDGSILAHVDQCEIDIMIGFLVLALRDRADLLCHRGTAPG